MKLLLLVLLGIGLRFISLLTAAGVVASFIKPDYTDMRAPFGAVGSIAVSALFWQLANLSERYAR